MTDLDPWFLDHLVCPCDHAPLALDRDRLVCRSGHAYPVVDGVPVLLRDDVPSTIPLAEASLRRARDPRTADSRAPALYLESLGISEAEKQGIVDLAARGAGTVDPVVSFLVGATSGYMYADLIGRLPGYPLPELRLPAGNGARLLDLGCSWGRWCLAAARKGYEVVGIDPSLGAVMAARRAARDLGLPARYLVADARFLPFAAESFDSVFSYSVLQHLAKAETRVVLGEVGRVLTPGGVSLIQMAAVFGVRSLYHQARRGFRAARAFEVRYWTPAELRRVFGDLIGPTTLSADCYFGLGLQSADAGMMSASKKLLLYVSRFLTRCSDSLRPLVLVADSLYVKSVAVGRGR